MCVCACVRACGEGGGGEGGFYSTRDRGSWWQVTDITTILTQGGSRGCRRNRERGVGGWGGGGGARAVGMDGGARQLKFWSSGLEFTTQGLHFAAEFRGI